MKTTITAALFALALPLCAQTPVSAETEALFYKAFYLERGTPRDYAQAMELYNQFLLKAPEHKLASEAAKQQFALFDRLGKTKERDAFREKYAKLLADAQPLRGDRPAAGEGGAAEGGRGQRGQRGQDGQGGPGAGGRMDFAARLADLEKQLAKAKEEGDDAAAERLTAQIERTKQMAERGAGGQGRGGQRGGMAGMGLLRGDKKFADMTDEEKTQLKDGLGGLTRMIDFMRQSNPDQADKVEAQIKALEKALEENKAEDAQKAIDALKEAMPRRGGRGGGGGDAGGQGGGEGRGGQGNGGQGSGRRGGGGGGGGN